jgi:predicted ferric reductase
MRNRYANTGWLVSIIVALIPIVIWLFVMPVQFNTAKNIFENIGKLAGLAGMALFAWNVILSARLKLFNKLFMGLDNTYRAHHLLGQVSLILLLIHPVTIAYRYFLSSPLSAYEFIKPNFASPFRFLGTIALFMMIIAMVITLYVNVKYQYFIMAQRALGFILLIGGVHAFFTGGSDLANNGIVSLKIYYGLLIGVAMIVYVYRSIFEIELSPVGEPLQFKPGQFAFVKLEAEGVLGETHPFSMSSSPSSQTLRFGIKKLGDYTSLLSAVQKGQKIKIDGPYGTFSNEIVNNLRQIWIAGGIGVTPFMSMARSLNKDQQIDLYYSVKQPKEAVYLNELTTIQKNNANFKVMPFYSDKQGLLSLEYIQQNSTNLDGANYMICGPGSMMKAMKAQLKSAGVARHNINTEEFYLG